MKKGNLRKATFTKSEGSQTGGVKVFSRGVRIRRGLIAANSEGSKSGRVYILTIRKSPICANPEGYYFIKDLGRRKKD